MGSTPTLVEMKNSTWSTPVWKVPRVRVLGPNPPLGVLLPRKAHLELAVGHPQGGQLVEDGVLDAGGHLAALVGETERHVRKVGLGLADVLVEAL
jgi:hypothetical protein